MRVCADEQKYDNTDDLKITTTLSLSLLIFSPLFSPPFLDLREEKLENLEIWKFHFFFSVITQFFEMRE